MRLSDVAVEALPAPGVAFFAGLNLTGPGRYSLVCAGPGGAVEVWEDSDQGSVVSHFPGQQGLGNGRVVRCPLLSGPCTPTGHPRLYARYFRPALDSGDCRRVLALLNTLYGSYLRMAVTT